MLEKIWELAINEGGIWCCLCIYLIVHQQRKQNALEKWVKEEVITAINASTAVMVKLKEIIDADKHNRDDRYP